jgi:hypothetical protein
MTAPLPPPIGPEQAALLSRHVSVIVGSRDARQHPHVMRAVGCRLSADRRRVTVLMPQTRGQAVLDDLRDNGQIAVVFSEPTSHLTLQLKGHDATVAPCEAADAALAEAYLQGFVDEIGQIGLAAEVAQTMLQHGDALLAVHFTVAAAFEQTPGPAAGEPLAAAAG